MQVRENTKVEILKAARHSFREKGFSATSMRDLAGDLDIKAASLYYHFESKESLLRDICFAIGTQFMSALKEAEEGKHNVYDKLSSAIESHVMVITNNTDASGVFLHEWRHMDKKNLAQFKKMRNEYEQIFREILEEGILKKLFRPVDTAMAVRSLLSSLNWIYDWYKEGGSMGSKEISKQLTSSIINGLKS